MRDLLITLLIAELALFGVVLVVGVLSWRRSAIARRVKTHLTVGEVEASATSSDRVHPLIGLALRDLAPNERFILPWLAEQMHLNPRYATEQFVAGRIAFALMGGSSAWILGRAVAAGHVSAPLVGLIAAAIGVVANWRIARGFVSSATSLRADRVAHAMPYALDLILICLDSGAALETAISRVAAELAPRDPLVAEELQRTLLDINVLGNRDQAFRNLGDRIGTANMHAIVTVLSQSLQYGSSLSEALKGAIDNMKSTELIALEERAGKLPVQLSLPGMMLTFPQVIILLAGPGVLDLLDTFKDMQP